MALAGLFVDCTWESQPSSCAFSWGPVKRHGNIEAIKEPDTSQKFTNKAWKSGRFKSHLKHSKLDLNLKTNKQKKTFPQNTQCNNKKQPQPCKAEGYHSKVSTSWSGKLIYCTFKHTLIVSCSVRTNEHTTSPFERMAADFKRIADRWLFPLITELAEFRSKKLWSWSTEPNMRRWQ